MKRLLLFVAVAAMAHSSRAADYDEPIEGGRSPNGKIVVMNIHNGEGGYFVIRNDKDDIIFSEKSLDGEFISPKFAWTALWRPDSRFVAIGFQTTKFATETVVFRITGSALQRVFIPLFDPFDWNHAEFGSSDNTHRMPSKWLKNGNLIMDITTGYHTKSDGGISGYYATIHFKGKPPKGTKVSETPEINRDPPGLEEALQEERDPKK